MKACLIGYNLTNFVLAIILNQKVIKVDILSDKNNKTLSLIGLLEFQEIILIF